VRALMHTRVSVLAFDVDVVCKRAALVPYVKRWAAHNRSNTHIPHTQIHAF
jgi:hypothetical protein